MAAAPKMKENTRLAGGLLTILLAAALLVGTVVCMRRCAAEWPQLNLDESRVTVGTRPSVAPGPTLMPNPYGPEDFENRDGYLTCVSGESWLGVDVSAYQGVIDWQQVAASGVKFAMIRIGFRAWGSKGELHEDTYFAQNLQGAVDAGLQVGVYFFSQAISDEEAREEARFVLELLGDAQLQMPVVFDWETIPSADARANDVTNAELNRFAMLFCQEIKAAGYRPMVYFNLDFAKWRYDLQTIQDAGYGFWLAMYSESMTYANKVDMWQYSCTGTVPGIGTNVDLNLYFPYK